MKAESRKQKAEVAFGKRREPASLLAGRTNMLANLGGSHFCFLLSAF
jgi:hypothetical protein